MNRSVNKLYQEDLELFPDYEDYFLALKTLDNYDFKGLSLKEVYKTFYDYAKILPTRVTYYTSNNFNSLNFYRARVKIDVNKEDISLVQTFSNPPTAFCDFGRANLKYKSVFYCSDNPICSILETKPKEGDEGFLSVWKGNTKKSLKLGICLPPEFPHFNEWYKIANRVFFENQKKLLGKAKEKTRHIQLLYSFIADRFIKEEYPYPLTSMISNEMFFGDLWRDFIVYPSLINTNYCNIAIHPNTVINNLVFSKVIRFKVGKIKGNQIQYKLGQTGEIQNNQIIWRERTKKETDIFRV